jgi:mRNA interferase MazF
MVEQGDVIWLDFNPQAGHEQGGRRPGLVVSNASYNTFSSLTMACPISSRDKDHPFHVRLDDRTKTGGVILCDQIKALDLTARHGERIESVPDDILVEVLDILSGFIELKG